MYYWVLQTLLLVINKQMMVCIPRQTLNLEHLLMLSSSWSDQVKLWLVWSDLLQLCQWSNELEVCKMCSFQVIITAGKFLEYKAHLFAVVFKSCAWKRRKSNMRKVWCCHFPKWAKNKSFSHLLLLNIYERFLCFIFNLDWSCW